jgi:hypothetical protein
MSSLGTARWCHEETYPPLSKINKTALAWFCFFLLLLLDLGSVGPYAAPSADLGSSRNYVSATSNWWCKQPDMITIRWLTRFPSLPPSPLTSMKFPAGSFAHTRLQTTM